MADVDIKAVHKELDIIQDVIKRMADNSFKVKAWMMSIFGFVVALAKAGFLNKLDTGKGLPMWYVAVFLMITVAVFWYLDAFFLHTERLFRNLYKWTVKYRPLTDKYLYDLNTFEREVNGIKENIAKQTESTFKMAFSKTLWPFYILPFALGVTMLFV